MPQHPPTRVPTLTSFRFLAAFWVLAFHVVPHWAGASFPGVPALLNQTLLCGYASVSFFYALSGFVLFHTYSRNLPASPAEKREFYRKRFARIAPVFYLGLALGLPLFLALLLKQHGWRNGLAECLGYLAINVSFLGAWWPDSLGFDYPGWSISAEFFFYLTFPFAAALARKASPRAALVALAVCPLASALLHGIAYATFPQLGAWKATFPGHPELTGRAALAAEFLHTHPLAHLPEFLSGLFLARAREASPPRTNQHGDLLLGGALALLVAAIAWAPRIPFLAMNSFALLPATGLGLWGGAMPRGRFTRWLEHPRLVLLGEASFSLYILHVPLRDWTAVALSRAGWPTSPIVSLVFLGSLVTLSVGVYKAFEVPMRARCLRNRSPAEPRHQASAA